MNNFRNYVRLGEGVSGVVYRADDIVNGGTVAMKVFKAKFDSLTELSSLAEVQALRRLTGHANIVKLHMVTFDRKTGQAALVMECLDCCLFDLISQPKIRALDSTEVLHYMYQLMKAVDWMHCNHVFHRDIKPENILIDKKTRALKVADLGSCHSVFHKRAALTGYVSTRWYRPPEVLMTNGQYGFQMDLWAVGCVMFEIMTAEALFPGTSELDMIDKIHQVIGTPPLTLIQSWNGHLVIDPQEKWFTEPQSGIDFHQMLPGASDEAVDLLRRLLTYDPSKRISAKDALRHPYFAEIRALERKLLKRAMKKHLGQTTESGDSLPPLAKASPKKAPGEVTRDAQEKNDPLPSIGVRCSEVDSPQKVASDQTQAQAFPDEQKTEEAPPPHSHLLRTFPLPAVTKEPAEAKSPAQLPAVFQPKKSQLGKLPSLEARPTFAKAIDEDDHPFDKPHESVASESAPKKKGLKKLQKLAKQ